MSTVASALGHSRDSRPRRVGVNLMWLVPGVVGGSEEYTTRLLRALAEADPADLDLTLFAIEPFREAHPDLVSRFPTVICGIGGHSKAERVAAEATWLAREARRRHMDLLHHAGGVVPPGRGLARIPAVVTIHDLQPLLHPGNFSTVKARWLATMLPRSVRKAQALFTPSDPVAATVVEQLGVPSSKVITVPHGVEPVPAPAPDQLQAVTDRYRLGSRVILYPAITYPHKNHVTLVEAFSRIAAERPDVTLVLTGGAGSSEVEVTAAIRRLGVGSQVRRTNRVPWSDLEALYELATVVAVPSRFEGFGAPALEAMVAGVPLVAAAATALPWVVGDGGRLVPADDVGAWADALADVLDDPAEQDRLAAAGRARAQAFTWERAGAALIDGYRRVLAMGEDGAR